MGEKAAGGNEALATGLGAANDLMAGFVGWHNPET
jgi:hypothetical protein